MKSRLFVAALVVVGLGIVSAQTASAAPRYFIGSSNWSTTSNWATSCSAATDNTAPAAGDEVVICPSKSSTYDMSLSGASAIDSLDVQEGADVSFSSSKTLTVDVVVVRPAVSTNGVPGTITLGASSTSLEITGGDQQIDGEIVLSDAGATLVFNDASTRLEGFGHITGSNASAEVRIGSGVTLELEPRMTMRGLLKVTRVGADDQGTLINRGVVDADAAGALTIDYVTVDLGEGGIFRLSSTGSLTFGSSGTYANVHSDIEVFGGNSSATVNFDADFRTVGKLVYEAGIVDATGVEAQFARAIARN